MSRNARISARISEETRERLHAFLDSRGVKQAHVIEEALQFYLRAMDEVPPETFIHRRVVITRESGAALAKRLRSPVRPNKKLRVLMSRHGE